MRVSISGSASRLVPAAVELADRRRPRRRCCSRSDARRAGDVVDRVARASGTARPGTAAAETRLCHCREAIGCGLRPPSLVSTTKPGRFSHSAAQPVGDPRPHARPAGDRRARVHERVRRVVVDLIGVHRADDADVVGDRADVRQELGDLLPRLAVLRELGTAGRRHFSSCPCSWAIGCPCVNDSGIGWPCMLGQRRLVVERLQVRRPAGHVQVDHPLGLRRAKWGMPPFHRPAR